MRVGGLLDPEALDRWRPKMADRDPQDREISNIIENAGKTGIEPTQLINQLMARPYTMDSVIEALQRAIERGKIRLNDQGMVICLDRELAHAA